MKECEGAEKGLEREEEIMEMIEIQYSHMKQSKTCFYIKKRSGRHGSAHL